MNDYANLVKDNFFRFAINSDLLKDFLKNLPFEDQKKTLQYIAKSKFHKPYIECFNMLEKKLQNEHLYYEYLGLAHEAFGNFEKAQQAYKKACSLNEKLVSSKISLAITSFLVEKSIDKNFLDEVTTIATKRTNVAQIRKLIYIYIYQTIKKRFFYLNLSLKKIYLTNISFGFAMKN